MSNSDIHPRYRRLIDKGLISEEHLRISLDESRVSSVPVAKLLVQFGLMTGDQISDLTAEDNSIKTLNISNLDIDSEVLKLVPRRKAESLMFMPVSIINDKLNIVVDDPNNWRADDWLQNNVDYEINTFLATGMGVLDGISKYYSNAVSIEELLSGINWNVSPEDEEEDAKLKGKVRELVDQLIMEGIRIRATDIHFNPDYHLLRVRYRVNGELNRFISIPSKAQDKIISILKLKAADTGVKVEETRIPQDGAFGMKYGTNQIDFRFSSMPTLHGENIVLRILNSDNTALKLDKLGMPDYIEEPFQESLKLKQGIILVTGPTGSGKTTTLYTALRSIDSLGKNVMTAEDPVEYKFPVIRQSQILPESGFGYPEALRAFLRQDPDVILVGEIRDKTTGDIAMKAASTGHLVLSTLHTNSAVQTLSRLIEMGMPPYLVVSTIQGIIAQRLVQRLCPRCAVSETLDWEQMKANFSERELKWHFLDTGYLEEGGSFTFQKAVGCNKCSNGHSGRIGVYEYLIMTPELSKYASVPREEAALLDWARDNMSFMTLRDNAIRKSIEGLISLQEALGSL